MPFFEYSLTEDRAPTTIRSLSHTSSSNGSMTHSAEAKLDILSKRMRIRENRFMIIPVIKSLGKCLAAYRCGASCLPRSTAKDVQRTVQSAEVFVKSRLIETSADWTVRCTSPRLRPTGANPNSRKADVKPMNIC